MQATEQANAMPVIIPIATNQLVSDRVLQGLSTQTLPHQLITVSTLGITDRHVPGAEKRKYAVHSRNLLVALARQYEMAVMMDIDVVLACETNLAELRTYLDEHPDFGAVALPEPTAYLLQPYNAPLQPALESPHVWVGCVMARQAAWEAVHFENTHLCACHQFAMAVRGVGMRFGYLDLGKERACSEDHSY